MTEENRVPEMQIESETSRTGIEHLQAENARLGTELDEMRKKAEHLQEVLHGQSTNAELAPNQRTPSCQATLASQFSSVSQVSLANDAEDLFEVMSQADASESRSEYSGMDPKAHFNTIAGSALSKARPIQAFIYLVALALIFVVLGAKAKYFNDEDSVEGQHRRLGSGASKLMLNIAFSISCAGLVAFFANLIKQPLILGYLLGGVLVGPIGLNIVHSHHEMSELSELGIVFLLFMIGLELDVSAMLKMGKVVIVTGLLQFPICVGIMLLIFKALEAAGLSFGSGDYANLYCAFTCGISSTMIVVKLLAENAETDSSAGRLTVGILIFQDIWAIIVLAIQPDLANPQIFDICRTLGMIVVLIAIALSYAKFVMPAVLMASSKSVELMLVLSLAWCFFMCCLATLPPIGLSMELAALISGVSLATFPYSAEFNGKIKYIRDFFITLFFVGLGMQIPIPTFDAVGTAVAVAIVVLAIRWVGIYCIVYLLGGGCRLAAVSTINLSQISEFALVICSLGIQFGHVDEETLTTLLWTFAILAILSSNMINHSYAIYGMMSRLLRMCRNTKPIVEGDSKKDIEAEGEAHTDRNIVFVGFHKIAAMLFAHLQHHNPKLLEHMHVIDFHEDIMPEIKKKGVTCAYGDISSPDVLSHAHHGEVRLVVISIPDSNLRGITNMRLLQIAKQIWPKADVICTADSSWQANQLYEAGADYVLRMAKLCAERLLDLIVDHSTHAVHHHIGGEMKLTDVFQNYIMGDDDSHLAHIKV